MEPAASIISLFAIYSDDGRRAQIGADVVSRLCGVHRSSPYRWQEAVERGGTGGIIPLKHHRSLLNAAKKRGLPLRAEHFLPGTTPDFSRPAPLKLEAAE